jgi:hypothetical protein
MLQWSWRLLYVAVQITQCAEPWLFSSLLRRLAVFEKSVNFFFKNSSVLKSNFFIMSWPPSQNRDGQPYFKFHMEQHERYICRKTLKLKCVCVLCVSDTTTPNSKTATDSTGPKVGNASTKPPYLWHYSVDEKSYFLYAKFEVRVVILFRIKFMCNKKVRVLMGDRPSLFSKSDV